MKARRGNPYARPRFRTSEPVARVAFHVDRPAATGPAWWTSYHHPSPFGVEQPIVTSLYTIAAPSAAI